MIPGPDDTWLVARTVNVEGGQPARFTLTRIDGLAIEPIPILRKPSVVSGDSPRLIVDNAGRGWSMGADFVTRPLSSPLPVALEGARGSVVVQGLEARRRLIRAVRVHDGVLVDDDFPVVPEVTAVSVTPSGHVFAVGRHGALLHRTP